MTIKCLAFDLDGTLLLDGSKKIDPRTFDSIQKAMAQGMHVVIASGRDKNGCKFVYEPLGLENGNHFLALVNGQVVYDFENKEYDLDDVLTAEDGVKIQKVCKEFGVEGIFQCGYDFYSYISSLNRVKKKVKNAILGEPDDYGLKDGKENRNFIDLPFEEIRLTQDINKVIMVHSPRFFEKNFEGIKVALNFLVQSESDPVIWRGPVIGGVVKQFYTDVVWGDLDVLLIDMPPGTGDVALTIMQSIPVQGVVMVSTPQPMVSMIVEKACHMCEKMEVKVLGIIENMAYLECPNCHERIEFYKKEDVETLCNSTCTKLYGTLPMLDLIRDINEYDAYSKEQQEKVDAYVSDIATEVLEDIA